MFCVVSVRYCVFCAMPVRYCVVVVVIIYFNSIYNLKF